MGEHYLRTQHHKIFHQLTADFQVMCLDAIEVTSGTVMEHRPHSGPEKCKYCILAYINFLFGLKFKFYDIAYFLCLLQL